MRLNPVDWLLYIVVRTIKAFDRRDTDLKYFAPDRVKNILVVSSTAIGCLLYTSPSPRD